MLNIEETKAKEIRNALKHRVTEVIEEFYDRKEDSLPFTKSLKSKLSEKARAFEYECAPGNVDGEWLYDVVWYKMGEKDHLIQIGLVMESEVSDRSINGIRYDFQKLLLSNSPIKVMLCLSLKRDINGVAEIQEKFQEWINASENIEPGEEFLILVWEDCDEGKLYDTLLTKKE